MIWYVMHGSPPRFPSLSTRELATPARACVLSRRQMTRGAIRRGIAAIRRHSETWYYAHSGGSRKGFAAGRSVDTDGISSITRSPQCHSLLRCRGPHLLLVQARELVIHDGELRVVGHVFPYLEGTSVERPGLFHLALPPEEKPRPGSRSQRREGAAPTAAARSRSRRHGRCHHRDARLREPPTQQDTVHCSVPR